MLIPNKYFTSPSPVSAQAARDPNLLIAGSSWRAASEVIVPPPAVHITVSLDSSLLSCTLCSAPHTASCSSTPQDSSCPAGSHPKILHSWPSLSAPLLVQPFLDSSPQLIRAAAQLPPHLLTAGCQVVHARPSPLNPAHHSFSFNSVQLLSYVLLFSTQWTTARQASLSITNFWSPPKLMSIESVMPSNHFILYRPLLLPSSTFPSIRVFSNESGLCIRWPKYWSFSFNIILFTLFFLQSGSQADMSTLTNWLITPLPSFIWRQDFAIWFTETVPGTE